MSSSTSQGSGAPGRDVITWNQSQHGKYNLQVSLKDVKIVAVINSDYYDDEDEDYEVSSLNTAILSGRQILHNANFANK